MTKYELAVVFNPSLDEEALKTEKESVKALIERFGGVIEKIDDWGKRKLAYEIKPKNDVKRVNEGFYSFLDFSAETTAPIEIESRMRINENVLRYLIVCKEN